MKIDRDAPVGVFDSGVGGLTVAREIMRNLPSEKLYISVIRQGFLMEIEETVIRYSRQIIKFLRNSR